MLHRKAPTLCLGLFIVCPFTYFIYNNIALWKKRNNAVYPCQINLSALNQQKARRQDAKESTSKYRGRKRKNLKNTTTFSIIFNDDESNSHPHFQPI